MAEEFDPDWEYWYPSQEMLEAFPENYITCRNTFDLFGINEDEYRDNGELPPIRYGRGNPDAFMPRMAMPGYRGRKDYGEGAPTIVKVCKGCGESFECTKKGQIYCNHSCYTPNGRSKVLPSERKCTNCKARKRFKPLYIGHKYCSKKCAMEAVGRKLSKPKLCSVCKNPIPKDKRTNNNPAKYCSVKCKRIINNAAQRKKRKLCRDSKVKG